ncbi:glycosyltransferase family 2 protein [Synechococcus sp. PCC 7336]|uniref:glycosyltransferase family 2 protein n=1 Tax=Synechococcus sp. PCC 7336 TaxID=195250 RepID=UPI0003455D35|nr:glycosyltransferase family 2 protein [Synechococcus sp. PCC 7336]
MTLLIRDGLDYIRENLDFHLARGVDYVVVIDNGSVDGSRDILTEYEKLGLVTVIDEPSRIFSQSEWMTRAAFVAKDDFGADWILNNDTDEFWYPPDGNLQSCLRHQTASMLFCQRYNMLFPYDRPDNRHWSQKNIYRVQKHFPVPQLSDIYTEPLQNIYFYLALPPKVMVRAENIRSIHMGNHTATFSGSSFSIQSEIKIYHFPVISAKQLQQKITQGGKAILQNQQLSERMCWHWRRWYRKLIEAGVSSVMSEALPSSERLQQDIKENVVVEDRTLQAIFSSS